MLVVRYLHPDCTPEHLGLIPFMLDLDNPKPAREQFNDEYQHGGGWRPFHGHTLGDEQAGENALCYPDDPPPYPLAEIWLREEQILIYDYGWVVIRQRDGSWECCRMD